MYAEVKKEFLEQLVPSLVLVNSLGFKYPPSTEVAPSNIHPVQKLPPQISTQYRSCPFKYPPSTEVAPSNIHPVQKLPLQCTANIGNQTNIANNNMGCCSCANSEVSLSKPWVTYPLGWTIKNSWFAVLLPTHQVWPYPIFFKEKIFFFF